jgi:sulfatase modifying factor 1
LRPPRTILCAPPVEEMTVKNLIMLTPLALTLLLAGCSTAPKDMIFVRGGSFEMGNPYDTADPDEKTMHEVRLDSFLIGRCEVTVGEFAAFVEETGYITTAEHGAGASVFVGTKVEERPDANWRNPYFSQDERHPVVCVSWHDAIEYCKWRSLKEGLTPCYSGTGDEITCDFAADGYRLPTEAEWEYAARSRGRPIKYAWGDGEPYIDGKPAGNTRDEAARREWNIANVWDGYDDGHATTAPAGSFAPNALGLCDISGSVYEWCWDWYSETYYEESPVDNPTGPAAPGTPGAGELRACRDCGFACSIYQEVVSSRGKGALDLAFSWGGFRLARSIR